MDNVDIPAPIDSMHLDLEQTEADVVMASDNKDDILGGGGSIDDDKSAGDGDSELEPPSVCFQVPRADKLGVLVVLTRMGRLN